MNKYFLPFLVTLSGAAFASGNNEITYAPSAHLNSEKSEQDFLSDISYFSPQVTLNSFAPSENQDDPQKDDINAQALEIIQETAEQAPTQKEQSLIFKILTDQRVIDGLKIGVPIATLIYTYYYGAPEIVKELAQKTVEYLGTFLVKLGSIGAYYGNLVGTGIGTTIGTLAQKLGPTIGGWTGTALGGLSTLGSTAIGAYKGLQYGVHKVKHGINDLTSRLWKEKNI